MSAASSFVDSQQVILRVFQSWTFLCLQAQDMSESVFIWEMQVTVDDGE